jgi:hypothetical protein
MMMVLLRTGVAFLKLFLLSQDRRDYNRNADSIETVNTKDVVTLC